MVPSDLENEVETNEEQEDEFDFENADDEEKIEHLQGKVEDLEAKLSAVEETNEELAKQLQEEEDDYEKLTNEFVSLKDDLVSANATNADLADKLAANDAVEATVSAGSIMPDDEFTAAMQRDIPSVRAIIAKIKGPGSPLLPTLDTLLVKLQEIKE